MRRRISTIIVLAIVAAVTAGACGSKSSTAKQASLSSTTTTGRATSTTAKQYVPCTLTEGEVSSAVGFAVHKVAPPNDQACDYRSATDGGGSVYVIINHFPDEQYAKNTMSFAAGGNNHPTITEVSGFPSWAFTIVPSNPGQGEVNVDLGDRQVLGISIRTESGTGNPAPAAVALAHKFVA
ncbi:MAG: hypothetical protein QOG03_1064 [Actinomycetota bacterium]|jgi:hypothetical protein|nr:hypothetical protein [Actinomycetota bacterium]